MPDWISAARVCRLSVAPNIVFAVQHKNAALFEKITDGKSEQKSH